MVDNERTPSVLVRHRFLLSRRLALPRLHGACSRGAHALQRQIPVASRLSPFFPAKLIHGVGCHWRLVRQCNCAARVASYPWHTESWRLEHYRTCLSNFISRYERRSSLWRPEKFPRTTGPGFSLSTPVIIADNPQ